MLRSWAARWHRSRLQLEQWLEVSHRAPGKDVLGDLGDGKCPDVIYLSWDLIGPQVEGKGHSIFSFCKIYLEVLN